MNLAGPRRRLLIAATCGALALFFIAPSAVEILAGPESARKPSAEKPAKPDIPAFQPYAPGLRKGEMLVYEIEWSGIPAGRTEMEVQWTETVGGARAIEVRARTRSNRLLSYVYSVDDDARSLIDRKRGFSRQFSLKLREGRSRIDETIRFDYGAGTARYEHTRGSAFSQVRVEPVRLSQPSHDPLSAIYALRGMKLPASGVLRLAVHTSHRAWSLDLRIVGEGTLTLPRIGTFKTVHVKAEYNCPGLFVRRGTPRVELDAATHIPLRMTVTIPIGEVVATLVKAENTPLKPLPAQPEPEQPEPAP